MKIPLQISFYRSFIDPIGLICSFWLASHSFQCARAVSCVKLIEVSLTTFSCYIPACFLVVTFRSVSSSCFSSRSVMSGLISALFPFEPLGDLLCCHRDGFTLPLLDLNICHCRPTVRAFRGSRQGVWFFTCTQSFCF